MKKGLIGILMLIVLSFLLIFALIPQPLRIAQITTLNATQNSIWRNLSDQEKWRNWWPSKPDKNTFARKGYEYNGFGFRITNLLYNVLEVEIRNKEVLTNGKIVMIPLKSDSILIQWQTVLTTSQNPVSKVQQYLVGKDLKKTMTVILDSLKAFNEDKGRVYKFNIYHTTLKDTSLVAIKATTKDYPSIPTIYGMINHLKKYISDHKAKETNYPMLNITKTDSNTYKTMVAIPTDKKLNGGGDILFKRMFIYKDRVLAADVKGGPERIKQAYDEINTYMSDYKLSVPVIHFEYLQTDRSKEQDTAKWLTKIYVPII